MIKSLLTLQAFCSLIEFDLRFAGNFSRMHQDMRSRRTAPRQESATAIRAICFSVDLACTLYWKDVLCLQRSAVTTWMLRKQGIDAELIVGVQQFPFQAHAWVEVEGRVVNDRIDVNQSYAVLDRI